MKKITFSILATLMLMFLTTSCSSKKYDHENAEKMAELCESGEQLTEKDYADILDQAENSNEHMKKAHMEAFNTDKEDFDRPAWKDRNYLPEAGYYYRTMLKTLSKADLDGKLPEKLHKRFSKLGKDIDEWTKELPDLRAFILYGRKY